MRARMHLLWPALAVCYAATLSAGPLQLLPDPERWEATVQAWEAEDRVAPPPEGAIVLVGSSSIRLWNTIHEDLAPLTLIHRGFGGSWMHDAVHYADRIVTKYKPRAVVLYEGDNDVGTGGISPEQLRDAFLAFVSRVHAVLPEARIYFLAIKPSVLRWDSWDQMNRANQLVQAEADRSNLLTYIDVASPMLGAGGKPPEDIFVSDMLHMNAKGYAIWKDVVRPILLEEESRFER